MFDSIYFFGSCENRFSSNTHQKRCWRGPGPISWLFRHALGARMTDLSACVIPKSKISENFAVEKVKSLKTIRSSQKVNFY